jgi:hypothetical protein
MPLIDNWSHAFEEAEGQAVFYPGDLIQLNEAEVTMCATLEAYHELNGEDQRYAIHTGLVPCPYGGNLHNADVYLLLLNAGFDDGDYNELADEDLHNGLVAALTQANEDDAYPFLSFDPQFNPPEGESWWRWKLQSIADALAEHFEYDVEQAFQLLSQHIAVLEAFPYHSKKFHWGGLVQNDLPSSLAIKEYVHQVLLPQAVAGEKLVVTLRADWHWGLNEGPNVIVYPGYLAQSSSLNAETSHGGPRIVEFLLEQLAHE